MASYKFRHREIKGNKQTRVPGILRRNLKTNSFKNRTQFKSNIDLEKKQCLNLLLCEV
jgi:hypothetical protein